MDQKPEGTKTYAVTVPPSLAARLEELWEVVQGPYRCRGDDEITPPFNTFGDMLECLLDDVVDLWLDDMERA